jgi:hypothetical protein
MIPAAAALLLTGHAAAVEFTLSSVTADTWTYTLTYNPLDNYAILTDTATLTLSGLQGVTAASGPTSTDYTPTGGFLDLTNLDWTAEVLGGGTEVVWTHVGSGTGNFGEDKHVFGFSVTAPGASTGIATFATTGFSTDTSNGSLDRNISIQVEGPVGAIPEPDIYALMFGGLGALGWVGRRRRKSR